MKPLPRRNRLSGSLAAVGVFSLSTIASVFALVAASLRWGSWPTALREACASILGSMGQGMSVVLHGAVFFGVLAPAALVMRLAGRAAVPRRFDASRPSYWVERGPRVSARERLRRVFR